MALGYWGSEKSLPLLYGLPGRFWVYLVNVPYSVSLARSVRFVPGERLCCRDPGLIGSGGAWDGWGLIAGPTPR